MNMLSDDNIISVLLLFHTESDDSLKQNVNLDNLLFQLRPKVTPAWYQFGEAAGVEKEVLDKFAKHCSLDDCVVETLDYWLRQREKPPTWSDVAEILRAIKLPQLALEIASMIYKTGKLNVKTARPTDVDVSMARLYQILTYIR